MKKESKLNLTGVYTIVGKEENNKIVFKHREKNLITTAGKGMVATLLADTESSGLFQYVAFGDDNTAVAVGNTTLVSEVGRVEVISVTNSLNVVTVTAKVQFSEMVGYTLKEIGLFGVNASGSADTGGLFSRALLSPTISKTNLLEIDVTYELTIS